MKKITIEPKMQYGQQVLLPMCDDAKLFCQIAGTKTITRQTLKLVKELGYTIDIYQPVVTLDSVLLKPVLMVVA